MSVSVPPLPRRLKIGSTLVFLAGLVPLTVASILYVRFWIRLCPSRPALVGRRVPLRAVSLFLERHPRLRSARDRR